MSKSLTPLAQEFLNRITNALQAGNGDLLGDIIYDAEMEDGVSAQLDLDWYEQKAA
jgi:hypothetical protein